MRVKRILIILFSVAMIVQSGTYVHADHVHSWSNWAYAYVGDCLTASVMYRYCDGCGAYEEKTLQKPPHTWSPWEVTIQPDCLSGGLQERQCNVCKIYETKKLPRTDHEWVIDRRIEPTCSTGFMYEYCKYCGKEVTIELPAVKDHTWEEWFSIKDATVFKTGELMRRCKYCSADQTKKTNKLKPYLIFTKKAVTVKQNKSAKLKVKFANGDSIKKWKSDNKRVATIKNGKVKGKKRGKAKITAVTKTGKKATCIVRIK